MGLEDSGFFGPDFGSFLGPVESNSGGAER